MQNRVRISIIHYYCNFRNNAIGRQCSSNPNVFPSFTATQSALQEERHFGVTTVGFIPILPYVATDLDSIYTSMVNFQDILIQRDSSNGAIWCDEGIYQLAKEIQLL